MSVVDDIRDKLDIVEVISNYVPLRKAGRNFKARCPFHTEKTPSFTVSPERQTWRCFGACATGGDIFNFVMRKDNVEFGEALRRLAESAGVEVSSRPKEQVDLEESLFRVNQEAARFYNEMLMSPEGRAALKYLNDRGIDDKAIEEFQLGYSPKGRDRLRTHLSTLDANLGHAAQAGLLRSDDEGNVRDFFFGRLMVPILDRRGRVAGFGGRSLDGSNPKYINTPATPIFDKQATLYALDKAASAIREQETAVIVEGYMDVIAAHQNDRRNVVASMGTALTERQVYLVRSLAKTVVLALDADAAGQEATLRSLEASWRAMERRRFGQRQEVALRIAVMPEGRDPGRHHPRIGRPLGRDRQVLRSVHGLRHSRHGATPRPEHTSGERQGGRGPHADHRLDGQRLRAGPLFRSVGGRARGHVDGPRGQYREVASGTEGASFGRGSD